MMMACMSLTEKHSEDCDLDTHRFSECLHYLQSHGGQSATVAFFVRHNCWTDACKYILDEVCVCACVCVCVCMKDNCTSLNSYSCKSKTETMHTSFLYCQAKLSNIIPCNVKAQLLSTECSRIGFCSVGDVYSLVSLLSRGVQRRCLWSSCGSRP